MENNSKNLNILVFNPVYLKILNNEIYIKLIWTEIWGLRLKLFDKCGKYSMKGPLL